MRGYYGIAVHHPQHQANVGVLWRSALTYQAAFLTTIGRRYRGHPSDTCRTPRSLPVWHHTDADDLAEHVPEDCPIIGVEADDRATPLGPYTHPPRALYLFGAEDQGLPEDVLARCHHLLRIDTPESWSLNLAVAGSLVMHDRWTKRAPVDAGSPNARS